MNLIVDLALPVMGGVCLFACITHLLIWLHQKREWVHAAFALVSLVGLLYILNQRSIYQAITADAWNDAYWRASILAISFHPAFLWFVMCYSRVGARRFVLGISALFAGLLPFGIFRPAGVVYSSVGDVEARLLPWGEDVAFAVDARLSPVFYVFVLSVYVVYAFTLYLCRRQWRMGEHAESLLLASSVVLIAGGGLGDTLRGHGLASLYASEFCFAAFVIAMSVSLSRRLRQYAEEQKTLSRELQQEVAERKQAEDELRLSEEQHRTLFESANGAILLMDGERFVDCNARTLDMLRCTREQLIGQTPEWLSPEHQPDGSLSIEIAAQQVTAALEGKAQFFEWRTRRADGSFFDAEVSLNCIEVADRQMLLAHVHDITERKRSEHALQASEERFRIVFQDAPDAIYLVDLKGSFIDGNRAAEEITGYTKDELLGNDFAAAGLLIPSDIPKAADRLARNVAGQPTGPDEFTLTRKDRSRVVLEIRTFPVEIGGQHVVLGIARDITDRRR